MKTDLVTHTPGPWATKPETKYGPAQVRADGQALADVFGEDRATRAANACLIAAAPDLLKALERALTTFIADDQSGDYPWHETEIKLAEVAIRKAMGDEYFDRRWSIPQEEEK